MEVDGAHILRFLPGVLGWLHRGDFWARLSTLRGNSYLRSMATSDSGAPRTDRSFLGRAKGKSKKNGDFYISVLAWLVNLAGVILKKSRATGKTDRHPLLGSYPP